MKVLSLFSGVGGFDLGLERAGMQTVFQCEWDKHATKILERHWPDVPRWDDVSTLTGKHILQHAPVIDIVAWGSPCQDLSVAGKRAGLDGSRSGLFHEGIRIIKELQEETNGKYPRISLWENVYGALSSNKGADFGVILDEMAEAGALVQEWRVLDAQYFGVPQRRRRVFLVSVFDTATAARCPDPLLPLCEGVQWHPATSHTTRQTVAGETSASFGSGSYGGWTATDTAITLSQRDHKGSMTMVVGNRTAILGSDIVGPLAASDWKFPQQQQVHENKIVLQPYVKSKRPQSATDDETWVADQPNPTLNAFDQGDTRTTTIIVGSLQARDHKGANHEGARDGKLITEPVLLTMREGKPGGGKGPLLSTDKSLSLSTSNEQLLFTPAAIPIQDGRDIEKHQNGLGIAEEGAPSYTIDQTGAQAVAYGLQGNMIGRQDHNGPQGAGISHPDDPMFSLTSTDRHAVAFTTEQTPKYNEDVALTLTKGSPSGGGQPQAVATTMAVRRLTPLECERLMGWPDNWTAGQSDTHRYKQCGNGVASPVAQWIAQQLLQLDKEPANATQTENPTT
jgi:DNA (cytosine-5)-methyltransferase 1